jgi:hypothetical protein
VSTPQPFDPYAYAASQPAQPSQPAFDPYAYAASGAADQPATPATQPSAVESDVVRPLGLAGRAIATGVAGLPLMAMDSGVALRNIVGDWGRKELGMAPSNDYELPSKEFQDALTEAGFPSPATPIEKGTGFVESALSGAATPTAEIEGAQGAQSAEQQLLNRRLDSVRLGMEHGYRVPPSTTNPTLVNQGLETIAGKVATQQAASHLNQQVTNRLAAEALGLDPNVPITEEALQHVRSTAASDYEAIGKAGPIKLDQQFKDGINGIVGRFNQTAAEVPSLANQNLSPLANDLTSKGSLSGNALLGAVRGLRDKADTAFRAGESGTGSAYKGMASQLENAAERDLSSRGPQYTGLVQAFRTARQKIAIAHTVEDAMNPGTGNVIAPKLAAASRRGEPLSGKLQVIADFANSVPKAVQEPLTSPISHLNLVGEMLGGMGGAMAHGPIGAAFGTVAYPAARMGSKAYLLSGVGQKAALPAAEEAARAPWWVRTIPGAYEGGNQ